jgi:tRNA(fMet)-specific endonuclease VapC
MLDTNICSFAMRHLPAVLDRLEEAARQDDTVVVSAIAYSELRTGVLAPRAPQHLPGLLDAFVERIDAVVPWDKAAADATALIRQSLAAKGTPIGPNDASIAGHALVLGAALITNNTREFARVEGLSLEDWTQPLK